MFEYECRVPGRLRTLNIGLAGCCCLSERHVRGRRFAEDVRDARIVEARGVIQQVSDAYRITRAPWIVESYAGYKVRDPSVESQPALGGKS